MNALIVGVRKLLNKNYNLDNLTDIINKYNTKKSNGEKTVIYLNQDNIEAILALREKLIAVEPQCICMNFDDFMIYDGRCPKCGGFVDSNQTYCPDCMQKLDWSNYFDELEEWE